MMMTAYKKDQAYDFQDFDDTDDISDDEVFIRDSKVVLDDDSSVNKPLMPPRRKHQSNSLHTEVKRASSYKALWAPLCYGCVACGALLGIICLVIFLLNSFSSAFQFREAFRDKSHAQNVIGCSHIQVEDVWVQNFPKLITESAIRLVDVNADGILDVILGFGTGADGYNVPLFVCDIYFDGHKPCFGGVLALEGKTGVELWRHYTDHEVFALNCNEDVDGDDVKDCLASGRAGTFQVISGKTGNLFWNFNSQDAKNDIMNVYTAQFLPDQNGDGIVDVLAIHGGDPLADPGSKFRLSGRIIVFSGKDGSILNWVGVPDKKESYYSPQRLIHPDGTELILFGTGGETHAGGLWYIALSDLLKGHIKKARLVYQDSHKGVMTPPVLADVNGDGTPDIIIPMFNSTVIAFDGVNFHQLWNYSLYSSESYSTPAAGYFNDDEVPDFLIKYQTGPGFPIYYYSQTSVLDGISGKPLLNAPILDTVGSQASALTVSVEGLGNDIFLYWTSDCRGHEGESQQFSFVKGTNVHEQSRTDFCKIRFNSELITRMYALNQHLKSPGIIIYRSDHRKAVEYNNTINTSALASNYLRTHPDMRKVQSQYSKTKNWNNKDEAEVTPKSKYNKVRLNAANRSRDRLRNKDHYRPKLNERIPANWKDEYNAEHEENVRYPHMHNIRKHGRYKNPNAFEFDNSESRQSDVDYMDESNQELDEGVNDDLDNVPWKSPRERHWYRNYANREGPLRDNEEYRGSRYHANPKYNYYKNDRNEFEDGGRSFSGEDSDLDWQMDLNVDESPKKYADRYKTRSSRIRRHVGPHDDGGIQRLISTGTLAPSSNMSDEQNIDLIFATYWFFPANTQAILPEDRDCIQKMMSREKERFLPDSLYYGMDHDAYEHAITTECLERTGHLRPSNGTFDNQSEYDPFSIQMGQMTVYRLRVRCTCQGDPRVELAGKKCARVLPFDQQGWPAYMGSDASGHFRSKTQ